MQARDVVVECTRSSDEERIPFPQIVGMLMAANVERYHADLVRMEKTYYMPDGETFVIPSRPSDGTPNAEFSAAGVEAAVRASQAGQIKYREFCRRVLEAGCVGYFVSLTGRRAVYFGRTSECHVELFPTAK